MIIVWIRRLLRLLAMLVVPPPGGVRGPLRESLICPACFSRDISIRFERIQSKESKDGVAKVRAICGVCQCAWYEKPLSIPKEPAV